VEVDVTTESRFLEGCSTFRLQQENTKLLNYVMVGKDYMGKGVLSC
jgi:hypothetical protein